MRFGITLIVCFTTSLALGADPSRSDGTRSSAGNSKRVAERGKPTSAGPLSPAAQAALKRAELAAAKVDDEARRKKADVTKRLVDDLKVQMRDAMRAGQLSEANALQAAIDRAELDAARAGEPTLVSGPSRTEIERALTADRTWYWHWENHTKENRFKFIDTANGLITASADAKDPEPFKFELRWVLLRNDHMLLLTDSNTLRGFFVPSGRQVGAFTEEDAPSGQ